MSTDVRENVCNISKNVKSHVFGFSKNVKNVKKCNHFVMQPLITELPEKFGTGKSRSPTSKILLRSVDKKLCN